MNITFEEFKGNKVAVKIRNGKEGKLFKGWLRKNQYRHIWDVDERITRAIEGNHYPCYGGYYDDELLLNKYHSKLVTVYDLDGIKNEGIFL